MICTQLYLQYSVHCTLLVFITSPLPPTLLFALKLNKRYSVRYVIFNDDVQGVYVIRFKLVATCWQMIFTIHKHLHLLD